MISVNYESCVSMNIFPALDLEKCLTDIINIQNERMMNVCACAFCRLSIEHTTLRAVWKHLAVIILTAL